MKFLTLTLLLAFMALQVFPQYAIRGKVTTENPAEILAGAHVKLEPTYFATITDQDGKFSFTNLKPGKYALAVSFLGYSEFRQELILKNESVELAVQLKVRPLIQDEVVIRSTRINEGLAGNSQLLEKREIESRNLGQDLPYLLEKSIATVTTSDAGNGFGYTGIRIRGTDMTRINVTINNIPLNDPESHNVFWVDLPDIASSTDDIQIQRGVGTSTNGAASFGASVNLKTSSPETEPYGEAGISAGSFNTFRSNLRFGTGLIRSHWSFDGRLSRLSSNGYIDRASSDLQSFFISGGYIDASSLFRINIFSGKEKTYQAWDGVPKELLATNRTYNGMGRYTDYRGNEKFYDNETDNYLQTHYQALFTRKFSPHLLLNTALHLTRGFGYYEQYKDDEDFSNYGLEPIRLAQPFYLLASDTIAEPDSLINTSDLIRRKYLDNYFYGALGSLQYQSRKLDATLGVSANQYSGNHFGEIIWAQVFMNGIPGMEWYRSKSLKNDGNLFAKTTFRFSDRLSATGELQFRYIRYSLDGVDDDARDITQTHTFVFFNPKASVYYRINDRTGIYGYFGIAHREPNRDNFVDANPLQPSPLPERLYDFETGYSRKSSWMAVTSNVYYMLYRDQLILTGAINDVGAPVMVNVPESYRLGLETSLEFRIEKNLTNSFNITLSRNKIAGFTEYIDNWDDGTQEAVSHHHTDISFSPAVIAGNELSWNAAGGLNVKLVSKFVSRQYIDNTRDKSRSLDPYFDHKLLVSYELKSKLAERIRFTLMISNLLNEHYETNAWVYRYIYEGQNSELNGYFPQAGIHALVGLTVKL